MIELVIVMMIFAIMATVAVPRFADAITQSRVEQAARRIKVDFSLARQRAKSSSASQTIEFDIAADTYTVSGLPDLDHPTATYDVRLAESPYEVSIVSADFGGDAMLIFDGYGVPDSGGSVLVQLGKFQQTVAVDVDSGRARVQ